MSSDIPFDSIAVREPLGPVENSASENAVRRYCDDWDDHDPMYLERSIWGGPVVPPAFQAGLTGFRLLSTRYNTRATIGAKSEHRSIRPARVGARLITAGTITEKYVRRGLEYVVVESTTHDDEGQAIRWSRDHILLSLERRQDGADGTAASATIEPPRAAQSEPTRHVPARMQIPTIEKRAYQRALDESRFAANSIHNDDYTRQHGYAGALMSAYVLCGYMAELLVKFYGPSWLIGGSLAVNFINGGVQQGNAIRCGGEVVESVAVPTGMRHELAIWMEKEGGKRVIAGTASGTIAHSIIG
jgi:hypothetical protein